MNILVAVQGDYGRRILAHLRDRCPPSWQIHDTTLPSINLPVVDEPEDFIPSPLPAVQLLLHLGESHQTAQLIPALVAATGARAVIAPVDHEHWLPQGLRNQLHKELSRSEVDIVFPEPFCSLTETTAGFSPQVYHSALIRAFAQRFGAPRLEVRPDSSGTSMAEVIVKRGSPCGSSHFAATRLMGFPMVGATPKAGLVCLHYPCLASMTLKERDGRIETLMHLAGQIFNESLDAALHQCQQDGRQEDTC